MNVENKYIATLSLVVGILTAPLSVAAETYTRDNPNLIQCDTCYSVADFERKAKAQAQSNTAGYHLVFNINTEVIETVYTFELYEPELGISMSNSRIVSTSVNHAQQYQDFLDWDKSCNPLEVVTQALQLPLARFDGVTIIYKSDVMRHLKNTRGTFYAFYNYIVTVKFNNGDVIKVLALPRENMIILIEAKDKDNNDISSRDGLTAIGGGSGSGSGSGGASGSVTITIPGSNSGGGTLMCSPRNGGLEVNCKWV